MKHGLGEVRRSQVLYNAGVGGLVDLPNVNVLVMGLHKWATPRAEEKIQEPRVLMQVRKQLGDQVKSLALPQVLPSSDDKDPFDPESLRGVPVQPFPNWLRCSRCGLLARRDSGYFELKHNPYRPERTRFVHLSCPRSAMAPPVTPSRFMLACENGHLADFPWHEYLGCADPQRCGPLRFWEQGVSSEVSDLWVKCERCNATKPMTRAFGVDNDLPSACPGLHPHLGDDVKDECAAEPRTILVGASNQWFPVTCMAISLPSSKGELEALVEKSWGLLEIAASKEILDAFLQAGNLDMFAEWSPGELWAAVQDRRSHSGDDEVSFDDLKIAEWEAFTNPEQAEKGRDFRLEIGAVPAGFSGFVDQVVLVEKLRIVKALTGFTRIISPGDYGDPGQIPEQHRVRLSRSAPEWVPAAEVRGEGLFLRLREDVVAEFVARDDVRDLERRFLASHTTYRRARKIEPPADGFPGIRYVLLHTLSHLLIRQLSIDCGYSAASIAERIYSRGPEEDDGPMAGILLYTAASDSEGTLGGLVGLGDPNELGRNLEEALRVAMLCSSDPLCSELVPAEDARTIHGAVCHACGFVSETSCERGNRYLDRGLLVPTMGGSVVPFFGSIVESM